MAVATVWESVMEMTKTAQDKGCDPFTWAIQLFSNLNAAGVQLPSTELAHLLVSHICWSNNVPITWKYLEKAVAMKIVPPMLVLALLSSSVIRSRKSQPTAYRLYLELLKRHAFSFPSQIDCQNYEKIMKSIDEVLHLSQLLALPSSEPGLLIVGFVVAVVWQLLDATLEDEGLLELTEERRSRWLTETQDMDVDSQVISDGKKVVGREVLRKNNTVIAVETIGELFEHKVTSRILYLARRNMCPLWGCFIQNLQVLVANSAALRSSKTITPEALLQLTSDTRVVLSRECKTNSQKQFHAVVASGSLASSAGRSALWLPLDLFLEDAMDGQQVAATSAVEVLTGLVKALQAVNQSSWKDAFLGLWIAALRLVQRERDASEGPVSRLDTCMCMLLSVATLAVWYIVEEEEISSDAEANSNLMSQGKDKPVSGKRRGELVSSLQQLGDFEGLLTPPTPITPAANQAAAKAMMFLSGITVGSGYLDGLSLVDFPASFSGNMRHLIVEACIAKNLLDTSAYLWPGYVKGRSNQIPRSISSQIPGWSSFMKGSPLTPGLVNALVSTPASSLAEIEKIYEVAVSGSDDEKISAATILCGASLTRGWNIQEHTVLLITKLLSPPVPADYSRSESHLIMYAPFINVLLLGISFSDSVQIFSLHGVVPQLAGTLMPICEVFGSCPPGDGISSHTVFSNAFTLLLKLWRFDRPPLEHVTGDISPVGSQLTPEYLLLVRNSQLASYAKTPKGQHKRKRFLKFLSPISTEPIFIDSFTKLKAWYQQHQECIASTLSALVHGSPVHQIVDGLLSMMFRKVNKGGQQPQTPATSGSSISSGAAEDASLRLKSPAWDLLEAVPFVLDAALTACAHGRLSPRELTTGLKDLADFLPASLATIVSYLSAEVTRGIWKPACMNGTDWPSPAANLAIVEQQIKKMLAGTGVVVPSLAVGGSSPATLPFPLAALVSLTITYKLDKDNERYLFLMGPALITLAASCPWPCLPIISSLWVQKAKRWSDFLIFSSSRNVFHQNTDAVDQLLQSCFAATLSTTSGGVGALLGHGFGSHFSGGISPVAPGILYLRVHRSVRNVMFMSEEIISLVMRSVKDIASSGLSPEKMEKLKKSKLGGRYGQVSLAAAMTRVKLAASLGASLVWITGRVALVQSLIRETLPSWFITDHKTECVGMVSMLRGYALAYLAVLSGTFAWGIDSSSVSKQRRFVLKTHLGFLANALEGKISLGCDGATWRAYVTGFVSLVVACAPLWMEEVDVKTLKTVAYGLRQWNEEELAVVLLGVGGVDAMGAAAELIVENRL